MGRGMTRRWGKRINPMTAPALLSERTMQLMLTPLHMAVELLPTRALRARARRPRGEDHQRRGDGSCLERQRHVGGG